MATQNRWLKWLLMGAAAFPLLNFAVCINDRGLFFTRGFFDFDDDDDDFEDFVDDVEDFFDDVF